MLNFYLNNKEHVTCHCSAKAAQLFNNHVVCEVAINSGLLALGNVISAYVDWAGLPIWNTSASL